ncbi:hypothetical protein BDM02DRAFT_3118744 [Thelephora ganbajun]|uniref:Uncharacterized protein n=1 Tax=Thelephora ganbajun TaxID=370292 RepID=A0ACB6Z9E3_THEGA|nr:hypothetical protein BDM02DRAFT_3118744 [Thelephora ganbajun]
MNSRSGHVRGTQEGFEWAGDGGRLPRPRVRTWSAQTNLCDGLHDQKETNENTEVWQHGRQRSIGARRCISMVGVPL